MLHESFRNEFSTALCMSVLVGILALNDMQRSIAQEPNADRRTETVSQKLLPTGQRIVPAGDTLAYAGRPVAVAAGRGAATGQVLVKDMKTLGFIGVDNFEWNQSLPLSEGASLTGLVVADSGDVFVSTAGRAVHVYSSDAGGQWKLSRTLEMAADSYPCGLTLSPDESQLVVCLSKRNSVAWVDIASGQIVVEVPVGVAPYAAVYSPDGKQLYVSNLGGERPGADEPTAPSADTETRVDDRGIALTGTVHCIDVADQRPVASIPVGLHPSEMLALPHGLVVCNTNQDSICHIDWQTHQVAEIITKPLPDLPFGSMPNGLALTPDGKFLLVALAGNNAIAVHDASSPQLKIRGFVPTAWYPTGLACSSDALYVANTKGFGARSETRPVAEGWNSHDHQGAIQRIALSDIGDHQKLGMWSEQVIGQSTATQRQTPVATYESENSKLPPVPVPASLGGASCFQHVIYVIKENRTFDQVFGDLEGVRADPQLCIFPEEITPNHHALAKRFGILDNYYCNGVLSADGHSWATEGNVTPYLERAFGGFARSYTFGDDPLTYSSSGFIWDHVLAAGLSFRNYGEMDYAEPPQGMNYQAIWEAYSQGKELVFEQQIGIQRLARYSCRDYPGWNMQIPDVLRMDRFLAEFRQFEAEGGLPNLSIVYLPQDHLGGGITGRSHMADNDLAVGRLVEAVSASTYWPSTLIVVNEDDPQNGFDHIDGHRSLCLMISAYSQPGVNHDFFNQTSVIRTILHVLGLPPMNQQDAAASLMTSCFSETAQNLPAYKALTPNVPLNEAPQPVSAQSPRERHWRELVSQVPIERTGMKTPVHEDHLNRFIWHEQQGWETEYPEQYAGPHGTGLQALGLQQETGN